MKRATSTVPQQSAAVGRPSQAVTPERKRPGKAVLLLLGLIPPVFFTSAVVGAAETPLPVFTDVTTQAGIQFKHSYGDDKLDNIVEGTGAGTMFFDYDGDGWLDIYLVNGRWHSDFSSNFGRQLRGKLSNRLYRNHRDGTFVDVTVKAGVAGKRFACGASAADYDDDGDLDLYILCYGPNEFYQNNGDGTFTEISEKSGLADPRWSLQAAWFDFDLDGDLDVYVVNYLEYDKGAFRAFYAPTGYPGPLSYPGQPDALFRNNGDGTFTDVAHEAGVFRPDGRGMGVTVSDLDNDGRLDIYVTNDAMANDYFRSTAVGKFSEEALVRGMAFGEAGQGVSSMGPAVGDVDRDGRLDLYIPDMDYGCLLMNRGEFFEDRTTPAGLAVVCGQYVGWGGILFDYDSDGYLDLYVANGDAHKEFPDEAVLVHNDGAGNFTDVAKQSGDFFHHKFVSRGATWGDFDNDGDPDVLVANLNDSPRLLRNDGGNRNHWLTVDARFANGKSAAIGARVTVTAGALRQIQDLVPVRSYLSQGDPRLHFGLGKAGQADRVEIRWPDGRTTSLENVRAGQFLTVVQPAK
ncbi:MAG: CRTAC1 family protein [Pirellulales bacterium]|nr:CRTAC1 family protein [Pirellulales bacterium]